mgnify:CR=1 FL=1
MKASREQIINAILFFAKQYNKEKSYKELMHSGTGLPILVKMIVYEMFIQDIEYVENNQWVDTYKQRKLIQQYAIELNQKGNVIFDE